MKAVALAKVKEFLRRVAEARSDIAAGRGIPLSAVKPRPRRRRGGAGAG